MTGPIPGATPETEMPERWWIVAPLGHRQHAANQAPETVMWLGMEMPVITATPDLDDWVCDWCNDPIDLEQPDGRPQLVPMFLSNALCRGCMTKTLEKDGLPLRADSWSLSFCACPPCTTALPFLLELAGGGRG